MTDTTPTIHQALSAVMRDVGAIGKNRKADPKMGGYAFRGIDDVYNALHGPLTEHGVFFVPEVLDRAEASYKTSGGASMRLVSVTVRYCFYGPAGDHLEAVSIGEAADVGDKAANKAMTAALKYLLFQVLCIPTESSEDADGAAVELAHRQGQVPSPTDDAPAQQQDPPPLSTSQQSAFDAIKGLDVQGRERVKAWMGEQGWPVQFRALTDEQADAVRDRAVQEEVPF